MTTAAPRIARSRSIAPTAQEAAAAAEATPGSRLSSLTYDPFLWRAERAGMAGLRRRVVAEARGSVLELGAGTGLNVPHYPGGLERLVLTEPDAHMAERLRRRVERDGRRAEIVRAPAELLPFDGDSFDTVVSTLALCTVTDPQAALGEVRRILRADGRLLFVEHVRSDDGRLARWQDRLHGAWASFADGCRCNQRTLEILRAAGFELTAVSRAEWRRMPRIVRPVVAGSARPRLGGQEA